MVATDFDEREDGFAITGELDFHHRRELSVGKVNIADLVHQWISEHYGVTPGGELLAAYDGSITFSFQGHKQPRG